MKMQAKEKIWLRISVYMANNMSKYCHLFVILVLVLAVGSGALEAVEGSDVCSDPLGACGPAGECDRRCKGKHSGGQGSCNLNLCTCDYKCGSPRPNPPERKCSGGLGLCTPQCMDNCCNAKCASKFNQGLGFCNKIGAINLCTCQYVCSSRLHK